MYNHLYYLKIVTIIIMIKKKNSKAALQKIVPLVRKLKTTMAKKISLERDTN